MRIWADWFEPSVVAHTTLLESYFAAHLLVQKKRITAVYQDEVAFV